MRLKYDLVVFDLEANQPSGRIIEIGAIKLSREGKINTEDTFQAFVNPNEELDPYVRNLCGITPGNLREGQQLNEAIAEFYTWAVKESKNIVLCSWGNYDVAELRIQCKEARIDYPFRGKSIDAKSIATWVSAMVKKNIASDGLTTMLNGWNCPFDNMLGNKHRALGDAYNTAKLLQTMWNYYETQASKLKLNLEELGIK